MKIKELLSNPDLINALTQNPPCSIFSGNPLTLVRANDGLSLTWENCMESDWWVGQQDGIYTRQARRKVSESEIIVAARRAGLDIDLVILAFAGRAFEEAEAEANQQPYIAARQAEVAAEIAQSKAAAEATLQRLAASQPELLDPSLAAQAEAELAELFKRFPRIDRMTRKLALLDTSGEVLARFQNALGMKAWLFQKGFGTSIDFRHEFVNSMK